MNKVIYAFLMSLLICFASGVYAEGTQKDLKENVVRLHIIANSNSEQDQRIKLKVRDAVLDYVKVNGMDENGEVFEKISNRVLMDNGFTYKSQIEFGNYIFPTKTYKELTFPKGEYKGMRVILGEGKGDNWWCVMNPPLCFTESKDGNLSADGERMLKEQLKTETYEIIKENKKIKFKIVEIVNEFINR